MGGFGLGSYFSYDYEESSDDQIDIEIEDDFNPQIEIQPTEPGQYK